MGTSTSEAGSGRDVLVVDDDRELAALVAVALEEDGYSVRLAHSGVQALDCIAEHAPDIAILDLLMPGMSGDEVCTRIRDNPELARTRVLVLSALPEARDLAAGCDADGAVVKPFTLDLLRHEVRRLAGV